MERQYHILNGDALKKQFPHNIDGEIIITRECLVDGDVMSDNLEEFFEVRAKFIAEFYRDYSSRDYYTDTVSEFEKIKNIPKQSVINLWFEDDLFCQVNFWFIVYLLFSFVQECTVFLIRPKVHTQYGFGGWNRSELIQAFKDRIHIKEMTKVANLWEAYKNDNMENLLNIARELEERYPFILRAVKAHIERIPTEVNTGRPARTLLNIVKEFGTEEFGPVFKEFCRRESIYGFSDLLVMRLLDEIKNKSRHINKA